jgi:type II secretory pathway component PulF
MNIIDKIKVFFTDMPRRSFKGDTKTRLSLYKVLLSSMNYKDTIKNAVNKRREKLVKRHNKKNIIKQRISKPGAKEMPFLNHVNEKLLQGDNFPEATKGWLTDNEQMLIESGSSGDLLSSIGMAMSLLEKLAIMKKTVSSNMAYPMGLLFVLFAMIMAFSFEIVPILVSISDPEGWVGAQRGLYDFCMFFQSNIQYVLGGIVIFVILVIKTLPIWRGTARDYADNLFPWSIYKELNAGIFLISLSTLIESGNTPLQALLKLKSQSSKYVEHEIDKMLLLTNQAVNPATAINTGFLGEVGDDIEDIAEHGDFEQILSSYGKEAIEKIIESITKKANNIKIILMVSVVSFLVWGYTTFISISQSATNASGM